MNIYYKQNWIKIMGNVLVTEKVLKYINKKNDKNNLKLARTENDPDKYFRMFWNKNLIVFWMNSLCLKLCKKYLMP